MKKIDIEKGGDLYHLNCGQYLHFIKVTPEKTYIGTTNEELIEVLIDRIANLNIKLPSSDNMKAVAFLAQAKDSLEQRHLKLKESQNVPKD